jgi:hypothetical protein
MDARGAVFALTMGALVLATGDALAASGKGGRKRVQTIELTRPSGGRDADATGTVKVTHGANGDRTTIDLSHLGPRTRYEIHDSATGALLGTVRTNRKGHATFNLTRSLTKSASANGSNAGGVSNVDIVDPTTGDPVLTGDVTPAPVVPQFGYADYSDDAGDTADAFLSSDPDNGVETFSFEFFPVGDPNATSWSFYDMNLDTSNGDALPLGVASAADLAGRQFQVIGPDGTVVLDDKLPDVQAVDSSGGDDDGSGDWSGDSGGDWNWSGDWSGSWGGGWDCPGHSGGDTTTPSDPTTNDPNGNASALRHGRTKRAKGRKAVSTTGYSLLIADAAGVLQSAGELKQETVDVTTDFSIFDPSQYGDLGSGANDLIGFLFPSGGWSGGSTGGPFDFTSFFSDLFGGFDWGGSSGATTGDPTGNGVALRHHRR